MKRSVMMAESRTCGFFRKEPPLKALLFALLVTFAAACKSAEPEPVRPLPFHVAVIPIQSARNHEVTASESDDATPMRLTPDYGALTQELASALSHGTFTRVTLLEPRPAAAADAPVNAAAGATDDAEDDWQRQAREIGADLIVECELSYTPVIHRDTNPNFWLNLPLFLIGGPFCWFLKDQEYSADVELAGTFHDLRAMERTSAQLADRQARVVSTNARFQGVDMNFIERAQGNIGKYAVTIFVPSGFLAKDSRKLAAELDAEVVKGISDGFARSVQQKRKDLVRSEFVSPFYLDPDQVQLTIEGAQLRVRGPVYLEPSSDVDSMEEFRLKLAGKTIEREFAEPKTETGPGNRPRLRYDIDERIELGETSGPLTLEVVAVKRHVRSYTFAVPAHKPVPAVVASAD
jgi:hypothetical protein